MPTTLFRGLELDIDATFIPGSPGSPGCSTEPPSRDGFEIEDVRCDGVAVALTERQVAELGRQLIAEMHAEADFRRFCDAEDRRNDYDQAEARRRCP